MDVYTTEEQQVEAIKKWWQENRWSLIGGVVLGIAVLLGGRAWIENQQTYTETASAVYQLMIQDISQGKLVEAEEKAKQILSDFSDTPYSELSAMGMAKVKLEGGDLVAAESHLRWALDNADQEPIKHEARLRLARVLLAADKASEAQSLIEGIDYGAHDANYQSVLGDIHLHEGRVDEARNAYTLALASFTPGMAGRELLQMKLDNLGK